MNPGPHPQHFDANPFFSNSVLKKEFKYTPPSDPEVLKKDANGVSQADIDFDFSRDVDVIVSIVSCVPVTLTQYI